MGTQEPRIYPHRPKWVGQPVVEITDTNLYVVQVGSKKVYVPEKDWLKWNDRVQNEG